MASPSSKTHKCDVCSKSLSTIYSLKAHMLVHCDDKPHICSICKQAFKTKDYLERHMNRHSDDRPFLCNICGATFKSIQSLNCHIRNHKGEVYTCSQCKKVYKNKKYLAHHIREAHEVSKSLECSECGKYFSGIFKLKQHLKRHLKELCSFTKLRENKQKSEIIYECRICNEKINEISILRDHIDSHPEVVTFSCDECQEVFLSRDSLSEHVQVHSIEKSVECVECGEKFTSDHYLRIHKQEHKRENGLTCELCQRSFSCVSKLQKHLQIHKGEKPFECEECGKCFRERGHLRVHSRVHTGEKPFQCELCNNRFVTNSSLKRHMLRHNMKLYKCNSSIDEKVGESSGVRVVPPETVQVFIKETSDSEEEELEENSNPIEDTFVKCELPTDEAGYFNEGAMDTDETNDIFEGSTNEHMKEKERIRIFIKTEKADVFEG